MTGSRYMIGRFQADVAHDPARPWFYSGLDGDPGHRRASGEVATWGEALAAVVADDTARHGCLCGRSDPPRVGDRIQVGMILGFCIEDEMRYARVVGHVKVRDAQGRRFLIREFRPGDGRWPSGRYARAGWLMVPWEHAHPQLELRPGQEPVDWDAGLSQ